MAKKKVFVSFDYDKDKYYEFLLKAWDANPYFEFSFSDMSSNEINTDNISRVKAGLTTKIRQATYTLVIIGEDANKCHKDYMEIGYKNWQNFEIARSVDYGNKLVGVKINSNYAAPEEMLGHGATWALSFTQDAIIQALIDAAKK